MSIMEKIFGAKPDVAAGKPTVPSPIAATQPGQPLAGTQAGPGTDPNGVVPTQADNPPLSDYKDLWKADTTKLQSAPVSFNVDPAKLREAAAKTNFMEGVTQEQMQAIAQGGEQAVGAMLELMNKTAQSTYARSAEATTKIVEAALVKQRESFMSELPTMIKTQSASEQLQASNPLFSNPAVQPIIESLKYKMTAQHPNASSAEIAQMVNKYVADFASAFTAPERQKQAAAAASGEEDWGKFFDLGGN